MTERAKVLILTKGLGLGGMERLLAGSLPHLDRERFEYEVGYFLPWKDDLVPEFESAGVPVHSLGVSTDLDPTAPMKVRRLLEERRFDLVHSHSPHPAAIARLATPGTNVRALVHTEHSLPRSQNMLTRLANRATYPRNDLTIAVSHDVARAIEGKGFFRPRRLRVVHGGLDRSRLDRVRPGEVAEARSALGIPGGHQVVGNVAHLRSQKGIDVFIEAAARIAETRPATSFVIVGREKQPGIQQSLETQAAEMGIGDRTHFTGFRPDPYPYLGMFDVFLMSSHYEGFPIALIEAMAMGKAVVATRVGGVPEAVTHGEDGLLIDAGDAAALADVALGLLGDESERSRLGRNAAETAEERFSIEAMVRQIESAYDEVLG